MQNKSALSSTFQVDQLHQGELRGIMPTNCDSYWGINAKQALLLLSFFGPIVDLYFLPAHHRCWVFHSARVYRVEMEYVGIVAMSVITSEMINDAAERLHEPQ